MVGTVDSEPSAMCEPASGGGSAQGDGAADTDKSWPASVDDGKGIKENGVEKDGIETDTMSPPRDRVNTASSCVSLEEWCIMSEETVNREILVDLNSQSSDAISQLASSMVTRDLLKRAETQVSSKLIDQIFRAIHEVTDLDPHIVKHFLVSHGLPEGGELTRADGTTLLVNLFMELLQCSPLPVEHNYLWLQLLYILILDGSNLLLFVEKKVAATVLGTMAVHRPHVSIQEIGCSVLGPLAKFTPVPGMKAPVRESGIEVIIKAMGMHRKSEMLMCKAFHVLANVTCMMSSYSGWAIQQDFEEEQLEQLMSSASETLDYIKTEAVPFIQLVMDDFIKNEEIQEQGSKIVACFGYHSAKSVPRTLERSVSLPKGKENKKAKSEFGPPAAYLEKRRVTFSNILDVNACEPVGEDADDSVCTGRRFSFCVGDIKQVQEKRKKEKDNMGKASSKAADDSGIRYLCPKESAPYDESDLEASRWKVPTINVHEWKAEKEEEEGDVKNDHGYEKVIGLEQDADDSQMVTEKPKLGEKDETGEDEDEDVDAYEKVEVDDSNGKTNTKENDYTELEALMAQLEEIANCENSEGQAKTEKEYDIVFEAAEPMDGYEVPMTGEEILKSRTGSMEYLLECMDEDDFTLPFAILFGELGDDDDGYEKIEIGAQEACCVAGECENTGKHDHEEKSVTTLAQVKEEDEEEVEDAGEEDDEDCSSNRFTEYSEIDIVEALVKSGLMNKDTPKGDVLDNVDSETVASKDEEEQAEISCCHSETTAAASETAGDKIDDECSEDTPGSCPNRTSGKGKLERNLSENDRSMKDASEMETSESDISNADENLNENDVSQEEKKEPLTEVETITRPYKKSFNGNYQSVTAHLLRKRHTQHEKRQGSVFGEDIRIENVNFRSDSLDSDEGLGYQDSGEFKETTCSDVNNSFGFPAPEAEDGQSVDLEYASDSSTGPNGLGDDPVYDNVCMDDENVDRNVFNSSPVSSISANSTAFTEGSEDAVQEEKQETQSMGSLEELCNLGELRVRNVISKSIHCLPSGDRQLMKEKEGGGIPPKPRRTWYYRSSADVRRSLIRSFGLDTDSIMHNPTYAQVSKPSSRVIHGSLPNRSNHGAGHRTMKRIPLTLSRHSKAIYKEKFSGKKVGRNTSHDSGVMTGDEDSRSIRDMDAEIYSQANLYEEVATVTRSGERKPVKPEVRKTLTMDEDTTEQAQKPVSGTKAYSKTTYEVCTQWVNEQAAEAISTFDRLTKKLVSPYSIIPIVREVEGQRRKSQGNIMDEEEEIDFPAWTSILNVLAADEDKWSLALASQVLPVIDRLFYTKDEAIMDAAIELVHVLVKKFGKEIEKNHHGGLFRTKFRDDCRTCYHWLGKLHTRVKDLVRKETEAEEIDLDSMLHASLLCSLSEALKPFTTKTYSLKEISK
ncbi:uncharacterized protein [Diadema antillarum]|uniref:uncharacterized protein n=1 Tax=Diadema antillarum TaxID=105358 RepID=UPI003A86E4EC